MMLSNFSFIPENKEAYDRCHEILSLPEGVEWSKLTVTFGAGEFGSITLELIPSGEQVRDLAELAIQQVQTGFCAPDEEPQQQKPDFSGPDMPGEKDLEQALLDTARED